MTFASLVGVAAALGIALALLGLAVHRLRLFARLPGANRARLPMEVVGRVALGQRQGMAAVRVGERVLLVSVGEGGVRHIADVGAQALDAVGETAPWPGSAGETAEQRDGGRARPQTAAEVIRHLRGLARSAPAIFLLMAGAALLPARAMAQAPRPAAAAAAPAGAPPAAATQRGTAPAAARTAPANVAPAAANAAVAAARGAAVAQQGAQTPLPAITPPGTNAQPSTIDVRAGDLKLSGTVGMVLFIGLLSVLPALLLLMTSFTRILIVLSFLRQALGTPTAPPTQLLAGLALLLTGFVMAPTLNRANNEALQPWMNGQMDQTTMMKTAVIPFREFMLRQTPEKDLVKFVELSGQPAPASAKDVSLPVLMSAFATSELRAAFQMGFAIFLPFIVVDLVVSAVLTSMGMFMLPPTMIALPCKLLLFVLVDGWTLVVESLVRSFR